MVRCPTLLYLHVAKLVKPSTASFLLSAFLVILAYKALSCIAAQPFAYEYDINDAHGEEAEKTLQLRV